MSELKLRDREAAAFLQGFIAAKRGRTPKWLRPHIQTAAQIFAVVRSTH